MSDTQAGQEGPTPDFIPGWFKPRSGNPDPAMREAVRIPDLGDLTDHFPITFLRSSERVSPAKRPQLGFTIHTDRPDRVRMGMNLAVPPGFWLVRNGDGDLHNWRDEDFKAKYSRSDRDWTPPAEREGEDCADCDHTFVVGERAFKLTNCADDEWFCAKCAGEPDPAGEPMGA